MIRLFYIIGLLVMASANAEVYRWVNEEGITVYSDAPPANASAEQSRPVDLPELSTTPAFTRAARPATGSATATAEKPKAIYESLKVIQPANNGAIRANGGNVTVSVSLTPGLMTDAGHQLQLFLDGTLISSGANTSFTMQNVARGEHVVHAQVKDGKQKVLIDSDKVSFNVLRNSVILNNSN